jgi:hypothetical protein
MGWMPPPDGVEVRHAGGVAWPAPEEKASMEKATIVGIDLAKRVFQVHAASKDGLAAIALANKMARSVWAMLSKGEDYRGSALAPA